jgi:hypothetical protein
LDPSEEFARTTDPGAADTGELPASLEGRAGPVGALEELKLFESEIERAGDLDTLKPIFSRLEEISKEHSGDFEVQLASSDLKQKLLDRGNRLKKSQPLTRPASPRAPSGRNRVWMWVAAGLLVAIAAGAIAVLKRNALRAAASAPLEIVTVPLGATISVDGTARCTSNCLLSLTPGTYQVTANLDGYVPATSQVTLNGGKRSSLIFPLEAHTSLRILSDLDRGKVTFDNEPPRDLIEGQFVLDPVSPGAHFVKIAGRAGEASFSIEAEPSKLPVAGDMSARNMVAVAVASLGKQARVTTNSGPMKLAINGQPEANAGPAGVDLQNFREGDNELAIGEARDQRTFRENFGRTPMLTVFLKSDLNAGTLIVSTDEDGVRVFINGKEYRRKTQRGEVRIPILGKVNVKVSKDGFEDPPQMTAEVKKGADTRLDFKLTPTPKTATLEIVGGTPGAEVLIDERAAGLTGADGNFSDNGVFPGDHSIEVRRDKFVPRRFQRRFVAGQTVTITGGEAVLIAERLPPPPPPPVEKKAEVAVKEKALPPPAPLGTISDFEDPAQWRQDNGLFVHRGTAFLSYKLPPTGVFTFTAEPPKGGLFRGGKVRWRLMYTDNRNYAEFEIGSNSFVSRVVQDGKAAERTKVLLKDLDKQKDWTIQIDVTAEHIVHRLRSGSGWMPVDAWSEPGVHFAEGKFGFFAQGNDGIALTDFKFQPRYK